MELLTRGSGERAAAGLFVIQLEGEFDLSERKRVTEAFAIAHSSPIVVVNFQKTTYIDSSVLICLLELRDRVEQRGAMLYLIGLNPNLLRLLDIARLGDFFNVRSSLSEISGADPSHMGRLTIESRSGG